MRAGRSRGPGGSSRNGKLRSSGARLPLMAAALRACWAGWRGGGLRVLRGRVLWPRRAPGGRCLSRRTSTTSSPRPTSSPPAHPSPPSLSSTRPPPRASCGCGSPPSSRSSCPWRSSCPRPTPLTCSAAARGCGTNSAGRVVGRARAGEEKRVRG